MRLAGPELVAQRKLQDAVVVGLFGDVAEGGRVDVGGGIREVAVIETIIGFGAELDKVFVGPRHQEVLGDHHIEVNEAGTAQIVAGTDFALIACFEPMECGRSRQEPLLFVKPI